MPNEHLVSSEWLENHLGDADLRIVDVRGHLRWETRHRGRPWEGARRDYEASHIPGAIFLDFSEDLVDPSDSVPLQVASCARLAQVFGCAGIGDSHLVVAYDSDRSIFATRLWWIFKLCGRSNIRVLDGGWPKWRDEDRPVSNEAPDHEATTFSTDPQPQFRVDIDCVAHATGDGATTIVDARARRDYMGEPKWADRGGHIPGALSIPGTEFLRDDGTFRTVDELRATVDESDIPADGDIIVYCGLGLSATALAFVLDMLSYPNVSVYDGSWAEWGAREDLPAERSPFIEP